MRIVKWVLGILVALVACLAIGGLLLAPTFKVTRSAVINAPADKVYALLAEPRRWKDWAAWNRRDPSMDIQYFGATSGATAGWEWKSKTQGDGKMTFTAAEPPRRLAYDLFFPDFGTTSTGYFLLTPEGSATRLAWTMNGNMGSNPFYRWMTLFVDRMVGADFDAGLANLKALAEKP